jgi:hypothetical protein
MSRVTLEKLIVALLVKKCPTFCGTLRFIAVFLQWPTMGLYPEPTESSPHPHAVLP